jgi:hypothetical protein
MRTKKKLILFTLILNNFFTQFGAVALENNEKIRQIIGKNCSTNRLDIKEDSGVRCYDLKVLIIDSNLNFNFRDKDNIRGITYITSKTISLDEKGEAYYPVKGYYLFKDRNPMSIHEAWGECRIYNVSVPEKIKAVCFLSTPAGFALGSVISDR